MTERYASREDLDQCAELTPEQREGWREFVRESGDKGDVLTVDMRFLREFGTDAGLLLSYLFFWTGKGETPGGWTYHTRQQLLDGTGIGTRYALENAREVLREAGVLQEERRVRKGVRDGRLVCLGSSPTLHYRVNPVALAVRIGAARPDGKGGWERVAQ
jgi:hypothetical protein